MLEIEKGVPFAAPNYASKWPFAKMEVGDSFLVPLELKSKCVNSASQFGGRNNMKFSIRKTPDGYRCWRIA
jgi:hypothetical protein